MSTKKNGYFRVPTVDPDDVPKRAEAKKPNLPNLKPGLFVMFGKDRRPIERAASDSGEEIELAEFKPRKPKHRRVRGPKSPVGVKREKLETIEEPLLQGDTLQRVALRYACSIADLRRINKLYSDQDFYALKTIQVPVREHGLLTEATEREKRRKLIVERLQKPDSTGSGGGTSDEMRFGGSDMYYTSEVESSQDADDECGDSDSPEYRDVSIQSALKWKYSCQTLLEKLDSDLQKARETTDVHGNNLREVRLTIDMPSIHPVVAQEYKPFDHLPDCRIILTAFIGLIVLIIVLGVLYAVKLKDYPHSNSFTDQ